MPYTNVPEPLWDKMDRCVEDVQKQGHDKKAAIAICHESIVKGKEMAIPPEGVSMGEMIRIAKAILSEPATEKASVNNNPRGGSPPGGGSRGGQSGGSSQAGNDSRLERCYMHMKKLVGDEASARKICHDAMADLEEKESSVTVTKQADGHYRWLIVSSSSYQDRDGEIVSQKALEEDTAHMNATKEFGTLDWWHTPVTLGACDFSAMHGRLSVESGMFADDLIGEKLAEHAEDLAASRSFKHSILEPDATKTYNHIQTFARALLPRGKESNILTHVSVTKEKEMLQDKIKELITRLGGDKAAEDKVTALLAQAEKSEQAADAAGITHKEETPVPEATLEPDKPAWFLADMKPEEFGALIGKAMQTAIEPLIGQIKELKEAQATATKEAVNASGQAILAEVGKIAQKQTTLETQVGILNGLTPKAFRASQVQETITEKTVKGPADDVPYISQFIANITGAPQAPKP